MRKITMLIYLIILGLLLGCEYGLENTLNELSNAPTSIVIYNANGSDLGSPPVDNIEYNEGFNVTVLDNTGNLVKTGYNFAGWNTLPDGTGTNYTSGQTFIIGSSDVYLYARWTLSPTYNVSYAPNGATGGAVPSDLTNYEHNMTVVVRSNSGALIKGGCTFAGWNTNSSGTGTNYEAGDTFMMGNSNITLYAKWTTNLTYTVTYHGNQNTGGVVPTDSIHYEQGTTVNVQSNSGNLIRTGYAFADWNTQADGYGTNYVAGTGTFIMGNANVDLYAKWTPVQYTVAFDSQGGSAVSSQLVNYGSPATSPVNPTRTYYTFGGWYQESGCTTAWIFSTAITSNRTLYAKWTLSYAVGGTGPAGGIVFYENPNYAADGWRYIEGAPDVNIIGYTKWDSRVTTTLISGADGTAIGTGSQNTVDMISALGANSPLAVAVTGLSINGLTGWFIPSKDELTPMLTYCGSPGGPMYWYDVFISSTEVSATTVHVINNSGTFTTRPKNSMSSYDGCRAVRRF